MSREREELALPEWESDPLAHLEHSLSLPRWLAERWLADYGSEAALLAEASNTQPPHTIRVNSRRGSREDLMVKLQTTFPEARACAVASRGIVLGRSGDAGRDPLFRQGDYTVQDEASQAVVDLLAVEPGHRVLDVCAAPGTKTTGIAERLEGGGSVLALYVSLRLSVVMVVAPCSRSTSTAGSSGCGLPRVSCYPVSHTTSSSGNFFFSSSSAAALASTLSTCLARNFAPRVGLREVTLVLLNHPRNQVTAPSHPHAPRQQPGP